MVVHSAAVMLSEITTLSISIKKRESLKKHQSVALKI